MHYLFLETNMQGFAPKLLQKDPDMPKNKNIVSFNASMEISKVVETFRRLP